MQAEGLLALLLPLVTQEGGPARSRLLWFCSVLITSFPAEVASAGAAGEGQRPAPLMRGGGLRQSLSCTWLLLPLPCCSFLFICLPPGR